MTSLSPTGARTTATYADFLHRARYNQERPMVPMYQMVAHLGNLVDRSCTVPVAGASVAILLRGLLASWYAEPTLRELVIDARVSTAVSGTTLRMGSAEASALWTQIYSVVSSVHYAVHPSTVHVKAYTYSSSASDMLEQLTSRFRRSTVHAVTPSMSWADMERLRQHTSDAVFDGLPFDGPCIWPQADQVALLDALKERPASPSSRRGPLRRRRPGDAEEDRREAFRTAGRRRPRLRRAAAAADFSARVAAWPRAAWT